MPSELPHTRSDMMRMAKERDAEYEWPFCAPPSMYGDDDRLRDGVLYKRALTPEGEWSWVRDDVATENRQNEIRRGELWRALQTRLLTEEEMIEVESHGSHLNRSVYDAGFYSPEEQHHRVIEYQNALHNQMKLQLIQLRHEQKKEDKPVNRKIRVITRFFDPDDTLNVAEDDVVPIISHEDGIYRITLVDGERQVLDILLPYRWLGKIITPDDWLEGMYQFNVSFKRAVNLESGGIISGVPLENGSILVHDNNPDSLGFSILAKDKTYFVFSRTR